MDKVKATIEDESQMLELRATAKLIYDMPLVSTHTPELRQFKLWLKDELAALRPEGVEET